MQRTNSAMGLRNNQAVVFHQCLVLVHWVFQNQKGLEQNTNTRLKNQGIPAR